MLGGVGSSSEEGVSEDCSRDVTEESEESTVVVGGLLDSTPDPSKAESTSPESICTEGSVSPVPGSSPDNHNSSPRGSSLAVSLEVWVSPSWAAKLAKFPPIKPKANKPMNNRDTLPREKRSGWGWGFEVISGMVKLNV
jgi:hypothetical protein